MRLWWLNRLLEFLSLYVGNGRKCTPRYYPNINRGRYVPVSHVPASVCRGKAARGEAAASRATGGHS